MGEPVQNYVKLLAGLSRASRQQARATARGLLTAAGLEEIADEAGGRARTLVEELAEAGRANRALLHKLVADEVDRAASRWGFVRSEDLEELRQELDELRVALIKAVADLSKAEPADTAPESAAEQVPESDAEPEHDHRSEEL